ncbi:hypothetical protein I3J09_28540 (plasmid) [Streptomyces clavuligerus]|uniref:hypothetical protein n=1 Tax=Streptomyces clavuligerus TaxID=1901 RepID=UPI0012FED85C|nr:hypothetical protein [Streptomyces clavuligerus]MBY6306872.1 hypothetical protein [Streptomyces clavuligerus]QPJ97431.1 hypothetical protein GE265_30570 [Streptomyces clavuligerus]QPL66947.1 hypothetical protein I3J04_28645 [Streptomyces clavuligerus]QPL72977.1 hypothetical protein I3J05_28695 [Streptomyces clavuligerus]QPL79050.1 hypothetical protein I3J06_28610 [Streptomyces clavuligerus]
MVQPRATPPPQPPQPPQPQPPQPPPPADDTAADPTPQDLDRLARRLVAPLSRLLRAELRGDRERVGRLRDG